MIFIFTNRDLWSRWFHAFCGGVMVMLGGPWCPANQLIDSSNDSCRHSVSCNGQLHHWMTSWEAGAGWLITMGASTSYHEDIHYKSFKHQQLWNIWKLPPGLNYVETNSSRCDMLRNGIWWLGRVEFLPESFMPESFKHLICSIRVSTVACRMALHDMPNPHLVDQENCLSREMKSQTKNTNAFLRNKNSRSIVSWKLIRGIHTRLRGDFLPVLIDCNF